MHTEVTQNHSHTTPKLCYTAAGMLIHQEKVLLVKHKKLGIWLNPGGHIDEDELPHHAAEREFFEETGIRVQAVDHSAHSLVGSQTNSEFFVNPIVTNRHWVNRESYDRRLRAADPSKRVVVGPWKRGCEQHLGFLYLVSAVSGYSYTQNWEETDGIAWFSPAEIAELETEEDVRAEIALGFRLTKVAAEQGE